jgi:hypothetical protein
MLSMTSIDKIYEFYNNQPNQHRHLDIIKNWFLELEKNKNVKLVVDKKVKKKKNTNPVLLIIGDTGIGKTVMVREFLKECTYDIIDIGKLFDIYESTNVYSIKDFIPKLLKQKNVSDVFNKKLLLIDSLEEFIYIQKTIIRDIIEALDTIGMPILLVSERSSFDTLEKKVIAKLKKDALIVHLDKPNEATLTNYINTFSPIINNLELEKIVHHSNGDIRNLNHLLNFCKIKALLPISNSKEHLKDCVLDTEEAILNFNRGTLIEGFNRCEGDPFVFGMLTYENYIHTNCKEDTNKKNIINMICFADYLEKKLFKNQQWELLDIYSFFSTIYPWKHLENPTSVYSSSTLQKYMNTKKRNRKSVLDF